MLLNLHIIICIIIPIIIYVYTAMKHNLSLFSTPSHSFNNSPKLICALGPHVLNLPTSSYQLSCQVGSFVHPIF